MLEKVKDLFSCACKPGCKDKSVIQVEISNAFNPSIRGIVAPLMTENNLQDTRIKNIDSSTSIIESNITTDISNYSKSLSFINQANLGKHQRFLKKINEEEEETGDHHLNNRSSSKEGEEEDTFRKEKPESETDKVKPYWVDRILILDKELAENKVFELEDEEGALLFNQRLTLNAAGLVNSLRQLRDGYAFFGTVDNYKHFIINDFILNKEKTEHNKRLFMIYFDRKDSRFYLKNLEENKASVYLKLTKALLLESKCYAQVGDELLKFDIANDKTLQVTKIKSKSSGKFLFPRSVKTVTIGRSEQCNIVIQSNLLSKIQSTIRFKESVNNWEICDGGDKPSTNGTWFLSQSAVPLCSCEDSKEEEVNYIKIGGDVIKMTRI